MQHQLQIYHLTDYVQFVSESKTVIGLLSPLLECICHSDKGIETYQEHLAELERCISESSLLGGVMVLGDFNAHLGSLGGIRGCGDSNVQGVLVSDRWLDVT